MPHGIAVFLIQAAGATAVGATLAVVEFLVSVALYTTVSMGLNKVFGKKPSGATGDIQGRMHMIKEPTAPRQVIYGQCRTSGPLVLAHLTGGSNEYLNLIIAVAGHECEELGDVYFNEERVISGSGTVPIAKYTGFVDCVKLLGTDAQTAHATMTANMPGTWTANHRLRGIAALYLRLKWDADKFPSGLPNINVVVKGRKLYDFRTTTTGFSDNPVLVLYDYLVDTRYGRGVEAAALDTAGTWTAAANICDEDVDLDAGGTEIRYTCNGITDTSEEGESVIQTLLDCFAGRLFEVAGTYRLHAGAYVTPDTLLDETYLRGPILVRSDVSRREKINAVKGTFANPADNYQPVDFPAVESAAYQTIDGEVLWADMTLPWTNSASMAQRLAKIKLLKNRQSLTCSMPCMLTAIKVQIGDYVTVNNTRFGWSAKVFEVIGFQFAAVSDGGGPGIAVDLELREMASAVFDWSTTDEQALASSPNTNLPDPWTVAAPTGLTLTSSQSTSIQKADGTWLGRIKVAWTAPAEAFVTSGGYIEVQYKLSSGDPDDYQTIALVPGSQGFTYIADLSEGETYDVRIRAVSVLGVRSAWVESTGQGVTVDTTGPGTVGVTPEQITVDFYSNTRDVWFKLTLPSDADFWYTEATWTDGGAKSVKTAGDRMLIRGLGLAAIDFTFTGYDRSGNASAVTSGYALSALTDYLPPGSGGVLEFASGEQITDVFPGVYVWGSVTVVNAATTITQAVTVTGVAVGDAIIPISYPGGHEDLDWSFEVTDTDEVTVYIKNHSSANESFSGTLNFLVLHRT